VKHPLDVKALNFLTFPRSPLKADVLYVLDFARLFRPSLHFDRLRAPARLALSRA
jgi:hypothetical protein